MLLTNSYNLGIVFNRLFLSIGTKNKQKKTNMAIVRRGDHCREIIMSKTACLSKSIVEMSVDYSGRGVTVELTEEEFEFFRQFGPDVGNTIYQTVLYSLKHVFNHVSDGFHWEFDKSTRFFKTHTYGL